MLHFTFFTLFFTKDVSILRISSKDPHVYLCKYSYKAKCGFLLQNLSIKTSFGKKRVKKENEAINVSKLPFFTIFMQILIEKPSL